MNKIESNYDYERNSDHKSNSDYYSENDSDYYSENDSDSENNSDYISEIKPDNNDELDEYDYRPTGSDEEANSDEEEILQKNINTESEKDILQLIKDCRYSLRRNFFIDYFTYSVPTKTALDEMCNFILDSTVVDVGAGLGLWSKLLRLRNIKIDAIDIEIYNNTWTNVEQMDCVEYIKNNNPDCLLISWGSLTIVRSMEVFTGNKIIIIGEYGGCTARKILYESYQLLINDINRYLLH